MITATPTPGHLRFSDVEQLMAHRAWPTVSILLATTPADRMLTGDSRRLRELVEQAEDRMRAQVVIGADGLSARLRALADDAARSSTSHGLAIFVSQAVGRAFRLPVAVDSRAVVERTFATRDLVRALHRTPPHLVLMLHGGCAHLYQANADTLVPLHDQGFPIEQALPVAGRLENGDDRREEFLARVDNAFGAVRSQHPSPMVLAGSEQLVEAFGDRSQNLYRLAGVVTGRAAETLADLYVEARAAVDSYLLSREAEALWTLEHARETRPAHVVEGLDACWKAVRRSRPVMLVSEEGYASPMGEVGDGVDDLIEKVIEGGGWVALARDGVLQDRGRVALVLDPASPPAPEW